MAAVMFTGCYYPLTSKQKGWISQIEKYYPDDTFTYVGHSTVSMGVTSPSCISLESENFPHVDVQIYEVDGKLYSNYPRYYHEEAVVEYFTDLKIRKAKDQIRISSQSFTEISESLGFSSVNYFSKVFKKQTNMTPSEYKKSYKSKVD